VDQPGESCGRRTPTATARRRLPRLELHDQLRRRRQRRHGTHGTSVAGVIGGRAGNGLGTAGVAPDVHDHAAGHRQRVARRRHLGAEAIRYAVDHGADVINASWGGAFSGPALDNLESAVAYAAPRRARRRRGRQRRGNRDTSLVYPASLTDAERVTVGSSTAADRISRFSAYGAASVDLFAPGDAGLHDLERRRLPLVSGTSIAARRSRPRYALYRAAWPDATAAELKQACWTTSTRCRPSPASR
jgi:subtilisin family serine protease